MPQQDKLTGYTSMLLMRGWAAEEPEDPSFTWATNAASLLSASEKFIRTDPKRTSSSVSPWPAKTLERVCFLAVTLPQEFSRLLDISTVND